MYPNYRIIVARHGNTFNPDETPRRVGCMTDIPLVPLGRDQALRMGVHLRNYSLVPQRVVTSNLMRTKETAKLAADHLKAEIDERFDEIDYGPDENKPEDAVIDRVGYQAMDEWNERGVVPPGWLFDSSYAIKSWKDFADETLKHGPHTVMVVTSNGIARFAPYITDDFDSFAMNYEIKLATGALGILEYVDGKWRVQGWNVRP